MSTHLETKRAFPWSDRFGTARITFRLMSATDAPAVRAFTRTLEPDDIIFLRMDIRQPEVINEWLENIERGRTLSVLAVNEEGGIIGYCSLHHNELLWTRHHGEIRIFVLKAYRGTGLGARLLGEVFQIAREQSLERLIVNIPRDQPHIRKMFESLGFKVDALLADWLKGQDGRLHDLLILSHEVAEG
ncbi:MAG: GNAT family N-acetyltransferase [Candidatus Hydrogenedentes bacterium]|nr:GNAT family N-acetyltransferase [Candidatus Hydrogenedentota bacterium]